LSSTESSKEIKAKASRQKGLVIINTGHGKGKTTAAMGLLLRAWGHNMKVIMLQFVKKSSANFGEHRAARRIGIEIVPRGAGFTRDGKNEAENKRLAREQWEKADTIGREAIRLLGASKG